MSEKSDHKDELVQKLAAGVAAYGAGWRVVVNGKYVYTLRRC